MPTTSDFLRTPTERAFAALAVGVGIVSATTYLHEGFHWIFAVPFGGSVNLWNWLPPGWLEVDPALKPWGAIAPYVGGIGASVFLSLVLSLVIRHSSRTRDPFWRWLGVPLAFGVTAEAIAGISEGGLMEFYGSALYYLFTFLMAFFAVVVYLRFVVYSDRHYWRAIVGHKLDRLATPAS